MTVGRLLMLDLTGGYQVKFTATLDEALQEGADEGDGAELAVPYPPWARAAEKCARAARSDDEVEGE